MSRSGSAETRAAALEGWFDGMPGVVVAFSGGVDSSVLLCAAVRALGAERVVAVTARSASLPASELDEARQVAAEVGALRHVEIDTDELAREGYRRNASDRCYFCRTELFERIAGEVLGRHAEPGWVVTYGAIADDLGDHRPGHRAAAEHGVQAPLAELGFTKAQVREYARSHGLRVAEKPAQACLASRIPYGTEVHANILRRIETAEQGLRALGFGQLRVRHHDTVARLELGEDELARAVELRKQILAAVRRAGYAYVALDLQGYRTGALNELLARPSDD